MQFIACALPKTGSREFPSVHLSQHLTEAMNLASIQAASHPQLYPLFCILQLFSLVLKWSSKIQRLLKSSLHMFSRLHLRPRCQVFIVMPIALLCLKMSFLKHWPLHLSPHFDTFILPIAFRLSLSSTHHSVKSKYFNI